MPDAPLISDTKLWISYFKYNFIIHLMMPYNFNINESISLSSSKSYMRGEIGYVTEVNLVKK